MPTDPIEVDGLLTRPIIGIENRTALEVFDIMVDRIRSASRTAPKPDEAVVTMVAQNMQDHMEQFHGVSLSASEWDRAALAALQEQERG